MGSIQTSANKASSQKVTTGHSWQVIGGRNIWACNKGLPQGWLRSQANIHSGRNTRRIKCTIHNADVGNRQGRLPFSSSSFPLVPVPIKLRSFNSLSSWSWVLAFVAEWSYCLILHKTAPFPSPLSITRYQVEACSCPSHYLQGQGMHAYFAVQHLMNRPWESIHVVLSFVDYSQEFMEVLSTIKNVNAWVFF